MAHKTLAFVLNVPEMLNHYREIWRHLDPASFDVLATSHEVRARLQADIADTKICCMTVDEAMAFAQTYETTVTHYDLESMEGVPLSKLAPRHARLMYSYGKTAWNTSPWNRRYDLFLVFGPAQADMLAGFSGAKIQIGYPRFDPIFNANADPSQTKALAKKSFGCDPDRKTVVWLPTWRGASSIDGYASAMAMLGDDYEVIVKPHPNSFDKEPQRIAALRAEDYAALIDDSVDSVDLYAAADFMVCDYGGPAFGAIYADKPLLLLNVAGADQCWTMGGASLELQLRQAIPNVSFPDPRSICRILEDEAVWTEQARIRAELSVQLFAPLQGIAGRVAALALENFHRVAPRQLEAAAGF